MSTFTIKSNSYLRNFYSADRSLASKSGRDEATSNKLSRVDSAALRKGIKALENYEFDIDEDDVVPTTKAKFAYEIRAFIDSYNNTLESSKRNDNAYIQKAGQKMSRLTEKYASELENMGMSTNSSGYLQISSTAVSNCNMSTFGTVFGKDSEYLKELKKYAKQINNHVDLYT